MKVVAQLLILILLLPGTLSAAEAVWTRSAWAGGAGSEGNFINPLDPTDSPVASLDEGVAGRLVLRFFAPREPSTVGRYTAQLTLHDGSVLRTYRGRGSVGADGALSDAIWRTGAPGSPEVSVRLARSPGNAAALYLVGTASLGSRLFALFALPAVFDAQKNPLAVESATGLFNAFTRDPLAALGTGVGAATIDRGGAVRLKATLGDLRPLTGSGTVLTAGDGTLFFIMTQPLARRGFFGGWFAFDPSDSESDWHGRARSPGSAAPSLDLLLAAYRRPDAGANMLPWSVGVFDADLPQATGSEIRVGRGDVGWRNATRLAALAVGPPAEGMPPTYSVKGYLNGPNPNKAHLLALSIKPANGQVNGRLRYAYYSSGFASLDEKIHVAGLVGAVNQKAALIEGFVRPRTAGGSSAILLVIPKPD